MWNLSDQGLYTETGLHEIQTRAIAVSCSVHYLYHQMLSSNIKGRLLSTHFQQRMQCYSRCGCCIYCSCLAASLAAAITA